MLYYFMEKGYGTVCNGLMQGISKERPAKTVHQVEMAHPVEMAWV